MEDFIYCSHLLPHIVVILSSKISFYLNLDLLLFDKVHTILTHTFRDMGSHSDLVKNKEIN